MLLVSATTYSIVTKKWKILASMVISFALIFLLLTPRFNFESTNLLRVTSIGTRINSMQESIYIFEQKPFGVGFNTYRYARTKYGNSDNYGTSISHAGAGVDNSFLLVLVTTGFAGLIFYVYLIYKIFKLTD